MLISTKRIKFRWIALSSLVIILMIIGIILIESGFSYKFNNSTKIPEPNSEIKAVVNVALDQDRQTNRWTEDIKNLCNISNNIVSDRLSYSLKHSCYDPNQAWKIRNVNCTGYAAVQVSILNYMFKTLGMKEYHAEWHSGTVYFLGMLMPAPLRSHCYTVVYGPNGTSFLPDACFKDLVYDGWIVNKENK